MATLDEKITRVENNIAASLEAAAEMGAEVPEGANSNNLPNLIRSIPKGGGASSWNDLPDRPVVANGGDTLAWDGKTDGLYGVDVNGNGSLMFYHISDAAPSMGDFASGFSLGAIGNDGSAIEQTFEQTAINEMAPGFCVDAGFNVAIVQEDNMDAGGIIFEKKGVYFAVSPTQFTASITIPGYTGFATEKFDPAYLYQPDWEQTDETAPDFVKNKPFEEKKTGSDTVTWDGNTDGLVSVMGQFYKVSDATPTLADFANGAVASLISAGTDIPNEVGPDGIAEAGSGVLMVAEGMAVVVHTEGVGVDLGGASFPEPGTYFMGMLEAGIYVGLLTIPGYNGFIKTEIKPLDMKFLPPSLQFGVFTEGGDTLTWDGNTEGLTIVELNGNPYFHLSSAVPTADDVLEGVVCINNIDKTREYTGEEAQGFFSPDGSAEFYGVLIIPVDGYDVATENIGQSVRFPKRGVYFRVLVSNGGERCTSFTIKGYNGFATTKIKPLDKKYLPGDLIPAYTAEDEGKVLKIVNGVPTWVAP